MYPAPPMTKTVTMSSFPSFYPADPSGNIRELIFYTARESKGTIERSAPSWRKTPRPNKGTYQEGMVFASGHPSFHPQARIPETPSEDRLIKSRNGDFR